MCVLTQIPIKNGQKGPKIGKMLVQGPGGGQRCYFSVFFMANLESPPRKTSMIGIPFTISKRFFQDGRNFPKKIDLCSFRALRAPSSVQI